MWGLSTEVLERGGTHLPLQSSNISPNTCQQVPIIEKGQVSSGMKIIPNPVKSCASLAVSLALLLSSTVSATPAPVPSSPGWLNPILPSQRRRVSRRNKVLRASIQRHRIHVSRAYILHPVHALDRSKPWVGLQGVK